MRKPIGALLAVLIAGIGCIQHVRAQPCATGFLLTTTPLPQNGTYSCGETVTFCLTITGWNSTNANWFHGVSASFGPGWDLSTLTPGPPPATCGGSGGTWGWYNTVQGTSASNIGVQGPGFFFDLNNDGNPGNNFGDFCVGATNWQFCWTISVLSPPACVNGLNLGVSFNTFGDSETGSWGSSACGNDPIVPSTPAVIQACPANAGTAGAGTYCSDGAPIDLFGLLGGTPNAGGTWTDPTGTVHGSAFDPAVDAPGTYTYTVTSLAPPCTAQASVQISLQQAPFAGSDATLELCTSSATTPLITALNGADVGGSWSGPSGAPFAGVFDPASDPPGVYTYAVAGLAPCADASATVTVAVTDAPNAGTSTAVTLCNTASPVDLLDELGGSPDAGGVWTSPTGTPIPGVLDPSNASNGTYTYTIPAAAPCPSATATIDVVVVQQPTAGADDVATFCRTAGVQPLLPLLAGSPSAGGTWTSPTGASIGANLNTATAQSGTYTYTVTPPAPCLSDASTLTITLVDQPEAGPDGSLLLCATGAAVELTDGLSAAADAGGTWTAPDGTPTDAQLDPQVDVPGTYTYTIVAPAPCVASSAIVVVTIVAQPDAGTDAALDLCSDADVVTLLPLLGPTAQPGGTWTAPDGTISTGSLTPGTAVSGNYVYSITAPAPCLSASATVSVSIVSAPNAGEAGALTACSAGPAIDLFDVLEGTPDAGGSWTTATGVAINPVLAAATASSGVYSYTVPGVAPCNASVSTVTLNIVDVPDSGLDAVFAACNNGSGPWTLLELLGGTPQAGGTWNAPDGTPHGPLLDPSTDGPGLYTYSITAPAPCPSSSSTVDVTLIEPVPTGTQGSVALCSTDGSEPLLTLLDPTLPANGTWAFGGVAVPGGTFNPATMSAGAYTYTLTGTAPCPNGIHQLTISLTTAPTAGSDGVLTACSSDGDLVLFDALGGSPDPGGLWISPSGASTIGIQAATIANTGTYRYILPAVGPCAGDTSSVALTIVQASASGIGGTVSLCRSDAVISPSDWLTGMPDTGGTWTDPNGTTIDVVEPGTMLAGTYTYTVAGEAPCPAVSSSVIATIQELPAAGSDLILNACSGGPSTSLMTLVPVGGDANGSWSDGAGSAATMLTTDVIGSTSYAYVVQGVGPCANEVDSALLQWTVHPLPNVSFTVLEGRGCAPLTVQFTAEVDGSVDGFDWAFGNGGSADIGPTTSYTYVQDGSFPVTLNVTDTNGCVGSAYIADAVIASNGPEALFYTWPARVSVEDPSFTVQHEAEPDVSYRWVLGEDSVDAIAPFRWTVTEATVGAYPICLLATDTLGCTAFTCSTIQLDDALTVYVPNSFTPDGDGLNEVFLPSILGLAPESYQLIIADRWGREVFNSTDHSEAWTGASNDRGELLPQGVYVWRLLVRDQFGAEGREFFGTVTLLK